jgi:hypothetical protein
MLDLRGEVHWKVHPRCERLIGDMRRLRYNQSGDIDKRDRSLTHASDAEGYRVHYLRPPRAGRAVSGGRFSVV